MIKKQFQHLKAFCNEVQHLPLKWKLRIFGERILLRIGKHVMFLHYPCTVCDGKGELEYQVFKDRCYKCEGDRVDAVFSRHMTEKLSEAFLKGTAHEFLVETDPKVNKMG